ncbi:MAG: hypothetical protein HY607_11150 [Planctomycetes bacterium]|uniref:hypothetical protein n=1 Tax=Candidatus Wunengus californicus TaxID=3367619 RepID=UPI004024C6C7|nr:hypothetical protein [Planctomycetota bacterium]MBI4223219.1 hypothetical protein [Planctomycetota bacterium]
MRKYLFFTIVCLVTGLVVPFGAFAAAKIELSQITPKIVRQNDIKILSIKGSGFQKGAGLDLGEGITVLSANIADKKIKAQITADLDAPIGKRDVVITNPDGGKGQKKRGLLVKKCTENCEDFGPFEGNPIPIHDKNSSQYRTDCTNAACHRNKLKETSLDSSIMTFHVLKVLDPQFSRFFGKTNDKKCLYCHKNTDLLEYSAGSLRKNVDVSICYNCHTKGSLGNEFYK